MGRWSDLAKGVSDLATAESTPASAWATLRERLDREFSCDHEYPALRCFTASNGARQYRMQCLTCGTGVSIVRKEVALREGRTILPWDDDLRDAWWKRRNRRYEELSGALRAEENRERRSKTSEWWSWYNRYLLSPAWNDRRQRVLRRANFVCEGCGRRPAVQAHHLSYKHAGNEPLFELVAVCTVCHEALHAESDV